MPKWTEKRPDGGRDITKEFSTLTLGTAALGFVIGPLAAVPLAAIGTFKLASALVRGARATGKVAAKRIGSAVESKRERERQAVERDRVVALPKPKSREDRLIELEARMRGEMAAAERLGEDEAEREAIREIIRARYIDLLPESI